MNDHARQLAPIESESRAMLSAEDMREHVNRIQQVMQAVMKDNTHYGIIPGTKKPALYKAGSETLLTTFKIGVDPEVIDLSGPDEVRYRVRCRGFHIPTGADLGYGVGECSSNEDKYRWRKAICEAEFEDTPENRRRIRYSKYRGQVQKTKQVRVEPADVANTVLKMAKKRAQIDLTLTATGASDIFTQDIEDVPEELRGTIAGDHDERQAAQRQTTPQQYSDEAFKQNLPKWRDLIENKGKTPEGVIATVSSKYALTDDQKQQIRKLAKGDSE